ncbi:MAG: Uridine nucleosidase 1 [Sclerophora amabilis]|nr:MAG: Uridine nucleosidase 1 [Sclerophora amabilis]
MRKALLGAPRNTSWLIATGALTNVALLFSAFPEVASWIKGLSIMGGAIGGGLTDAPISKMPGEQDRVGNITPWAEFNIHCDPESAHSIFSNPALASKTTLIPLDLTHQVLATPPILARLLPSQQQSPQAPSTQQANVSTSSPTSTSIRARNLRPLFHDLLTYFASTYARVFGISAGPPLHDPLAVAVVLADHPDPEYRIWFSDESSARDAEVSTRWHIDVVTAGDTGEISHNNMLGRTVAKPITRRPSTSSPLAPGNGGNPLDNDPVVDSLGLRSNVPSSPNGVGGGVRIMRAVDVEKFWTVILEGSVVRAEEALGPSR